MSQTTGWLPGGRQDQLNMAREWITVPDRGHRQNSRFGLDAGCWYDRGDMDKAIADYTEAIRLKPDYAWAYHNRGMACRNKGDYARARADWEKVLRIGPQ